MKIVGIVLSVALLVAASDGVAQGWSTPSGEVLPDTPASKSRDGFSATLVVTPDKDWKEKWDTPPETTPHFSEAREVAEGGELYILTFVANPMLDEARRADVTCDFAVTRPDGSRSVDERELPCFVATVDGDPKNVYLTAASLKYVAEPSDLRGEWVVDVTLRDNLRGVELPLRTSFIVK